jgi:hypothetical protein
MRSDRLWQSGLLIQAASMVSGRVGSLSHMYSHLAGVGDFGHRSDQCTPREAVWPRGCNVG